MKGELGGRTESWGYGMGGLSTVYPCVREISLSFVKELQTFKNSFWPLF